MTSITIKPFKIAPVANIPFMVSGIYNGSLPLKFNDAPGPTFKYSLSWSMVHGGLPPGSHDVTVTDKVSGSNATIAIFLPDLNQSVDILGQMVLDDQNKVLA